MADKVWGKTRIVLEQGDITRAPVDAVVNAANSRLAGGGGVDGAIHRAGGPAIMAECRKIGGCLTGEAVITTAGDLKAQKVIHTVGPVYSASPADAGLLASCYTKSLELALKNGIVSLAFPSISTGAYGYPLAEAASVALKAVRSFLEDHPGVFREVRFYLFGDHAFKVYSKALDALD